MASDSLILIPIKKGDSKLPVSVIVWRGVVHNFATGEANLTVI